jgi:tRNA-specific 2-thiouridylase
MPLTQPPHRRPGVLLGLSGGVDSGVAALLLTQGGYRVEAVTFGLWTDPEASGSNRCCTADTILTARRLAEHLDISHDLVDLSKEFFECVVSYFVSTYAAAQTPNPCVHCNARLRLPILACMADELGLEHVATGHYARLDPQSLGLLRGRDPLKDQSYVLAQVDPALLRRAVFPLGELTKPEVRAIAHDHGLPVEASPESQDICFVPDGDYRRFLARRVSGSSGPILDTEGRTRGAHEGLYRYTIGQRRGLGVADSEPLYVVEQRLSDNALIVGRAADLEVMGLQLTDVVVHRPHPGGDEVNVAVQYRSTGESAPARLEPYDPNVRSLQVAFSEPAAGVAPGQLAVVYHEESVLLSGSITSTARRGE